MRTWSLARQLFALQAAVVAIVLAGVTLAAYLQFDGQNRDATAEEMLGIAHTLAASPTVIDALRDPAPTVALQQLAERVRLDTATDFVVVMTPDGTRFTHPNPAEIGRRFLGTIAPSARGESITETYVGTLGPSVRAVVPVIDGGRVVALVAVGRTVAAVARDLARQVPVILGAAAAALLLAAGGSWLVSRWLRRSTHDLGPAELSRMYEYYDAVLYAVREGLLLLDGQGRVQLVNDEARRLLGLTDDALGRPADAIGLPQALGAALATGEPRTDEIHLTAERIVVVNQNAAVRDGRDLGTVVTLRDHTELRALVSELATIRGFADSLNAQAHEAANQLHTVIALIELGRADEALEFATTELAVAQHLTDAVLGAIAVPEVAALVVGKAAEAGERGVELSLEDGALLPAGVADPHDLVMILGNLLDNAIDAALEAPEPREVRLGAGTENGGVFLRVTDSGPGLAPGDAERAFVRGFSTKDHGDGLGRGLGLALVRQAAHRNGGAVRVDGATFTVRLPVRSVVRAPAERLGGGPAGHRMIRTLVVEDDPIAAAAHAAYVARVPGFGVVAQAAAGVPALRALATTAVDLVLLDVHLPDMSGLEVLRRMRAAGHTTDVIMVTRARDLAVVQAAVAFGATQYLVKPFTFAVVRAKLQGHLEYRERLDGGPVLAQGDVDGLLGSLRGPGAAGGTGLPKGINRESLDATAQALEAAGPDVGLTAVEMAEALGASRVTARRYLEYLVETGLGERNARYGGAGRPQVEYRWRPGGTP